MEALRRTKLVYPTVGVCWHEGTPGKLIDLTVDLIANGYTTPAFFGDETIQKGLKSLGVPRNQSSRYINSTCVEITPSGASNVWVASPYFSTCKIMLDEISDEVDSGNTAESFDKFIDCYYSRMASQIAEAVDRQREFRRLRKERGRKPMQSVFTRDCIERGRDIDDGGAIYNWIECSFVGLANLADSLYVIREEVFKTNRHSLEEIKTIVDADFKGFEVEHQRFLTGYPKYGQGNAEVDGLFEKTVQFVKEECAKHPVDDSGTPFVPGAFCWVMHERLGSECGATPDGRRAGFPFADGCGPAQGRERCGPTAAILSTTSWDHSPMIGGLAYNMKFNSTLFSSPGSLSRLRDLVLTFLRRGGFETQINVVDRKILQRAKEHPEEYQDLIVRIGGYTDYFTRLSPAMQDEILMRTEFDTV
jgi:formate C-acetyltransferase